MINNIPMIDDLRNLRLNTLKPLEWHFYQVRYSTRIHGEPLAFPVAILTGPEEGPRVSIVAGVHGDEFEGIRASWDLMRDKAIQLKSGTLIVVPVANVPAYEAGTRTNPLDGMNLARIFPGESKGSPSERLAHALFHQIVVGSSLLVDLHSGGRRYLHLPLAGFYDVPGVIGNQSFSAAQALNWNYLWSAPHRVGVLSYEAIKHGIPAIGTEVGGASRCLKKDTEIYPSTFRRLLSFYGLLDPSPSAQHRTNSHKIIDGDWYICPKAGFLETIVELGQSVKKGTLLGKIFNSWGQVQDEVHAQNNGIVVGIRSFPTILEGEWSIFVGVERLKE